jgi:hypothetical protein
MDGFGAGMISLSSPGKIFIERLVFAEMPLEFSRRYVFLALYPNEFRPAFMIIEK